MSDTMLHGILQMPTELWTNDAIDTAQRHGRYLEASKRIMELERERDEARRERNELRHALEWIVGQYGHEKTTAQLAIEAYEMFYMARWTLQGMKQKEEA